MLLVIVAIGFVLRFISLMNAGSFWFDETFTLYFARMPWREAWQYLQFENNPPLHFFLARIFVLIFGQNEFWLRLTSMAMSVGTIPVVYFLGKKVHSRTSGLIGAALFAVSGLSIFNGVEFRPYSLLILLTAASLYFFINYLESSKRKTLIILSLLNAVLLLTHLTAVMVVMIETFYILWRKREQFWHWCLYQGAPIAAFLVWWLPAFLTKEVVDVANSWFFSSSFDLLFVVRQIYAFLVFPVSDGFPTWAIIIVGISLVALIIRTFGRFSTVKEKRQFEFEPSSLKYGDFLILLAIIPVLFGFVLNVQISKQYSISLIPFVILLGAGAAELMKNKPPHLSRRCGGEKSRLAFILFVVVAFAILNYPAIWRKPYTLDKLVQTIEQETKSNAEILAAAHIYTLPLELYYHGAMPVKPVYFGADSADSRMRLARHNWHINYYTKEDLDLFLSEEVKKYNTILVVGTTHWQNEGDIVRQWFMRHGWRLARTYSWDLNPDLHVFKKIMK